MFIRQIEMPERKAEGYFRGVPYDTFLSGPEGCSVHFWMGNDPSLERARQLAMLMTNHIDVIGCTFSTGQPSGFFTNKPTELPDAG